MVIRKRVLFWGSALVGLVVFGGIAALLISFTGGTGVPSATTTVLSAQDLTATLCAVQTAQGKEYVMLYELFETPTFSAAQAAIATVTPIPTGVSAGDAQRGKEIFFGIGACDACHRIEDDLLVVGPSLLGISQRANQRVIGLKGSEYLRASILRPDEFLVEGSLPGIMPFSYEQTLQTEQIDDLIAYLLTL
ncbi:MAG: c-type cytochrome [Anaerolineae bacterium]|nr:c-type cytochrome [Anaerolineae bacterium]